MIGFRGLVLSSLMLAALAVSSEVVRAEESKAPATTHAPTPAPIDRNGC
jgi:hypothetical protein